MPRDRQGLSRGEWCVLARIAEGPAHGWALWHEFGPDSELGQVWAANQQRIYRALWALERLGFIEPVSGGPEVASTTRRPPRIVYRITPAGRTAVGGWLREPVASIRDVPSTFVLKLTFGRRLGESLTPLLVAQRAAVAAAVESQERRLAEPDGSEQLDLRMQHRTTTVLLAFIDELREEAARWAGPSDVRGGAQALSDFSGRAIRRRRDGATVVVHFDDPGRKTVSATAHIRDNVVGDVARAVEQSAPALKARPA